MVEQEMASASEAVESAAARIEVRVQNIETVILFTNATSHTFCFLVC